MPVMHGPTRSARRRRAARRPAHPPRRGGKVPAVAHPSLRRGAWLAPAEALVIGGQQLQPRLPCRDCAGSTAADAERLPPRRPNDPPLLGLGTLLRANRARTGSPPRRRPRAAVEPVRPHPRGTPRRLGRAAELPITPRPTDPIPALKKSAKLIKSLVTSNANLEIVNLRTS